MKFKYPCFISGADPSLTILLHIAPRHTSGGLSSRTQIAYTQIFIKFLTFVHPHRLPLYSPSPQVIVAFVDFLLAEGIKYPTIANYVSALKYQFIRFDLSYHVIDSNGS